METTIQGVGYRNFAFISKVHRDIPDNGESNGKDYGT